MTKWEYLLIDSKNLPEAGKGMFKAAKVTLEQAIRIREETAPDDPVAIARTRHRLGLVRKNLGDYATARSDFLVSAAVFEAEFQGWFQNLRSD